MNDTRAITCPMCKTKLDSVPDDFPYRPFCSERCRLLDLDNWLSGTYRISEPVPVEGDDLN